MYSYVYLLGMENLGLTVILVKKKRKVSICKVWMNTVLIIIKTVLVWSRILKIEQKKICQSFLNRIFIPLSETKAGGFPEL